MLEGSAMVRAHLVSGAGGPAWVERGRASESGDTKVVRWELEWLRSEWKGVRWLRIANLIQDWSTRELNGRSRFRFAFPFVRSGAARHTGEPPHKTHAPLLLRTPASCRHHRRAQEASPCHGQLIPKPTAEPTLEPTASTNKPAFISSASVQFGQNRNRNRISIEIWNRLEIE